MNINRNRKHMLGVDEKSTKYRRNKYVIPVRECWAGKWKGFLLFYSIYESLGLVFKLHFDETIESSMPGKILVRNELVWKRMRK